MKQLTVKGVRYRCVGGDVWDWYSKTSKRWFQCVPAAGMMLDALHTAMEALRKYAELDHGLGVIARASIKEIEEE